MHSDLTLDEFRQQYTRSVPQYDQYDQYYQYDQYDQYYQYDQVPDHVDWRDSGVVSAVQDQGQCGSCWSWAVAGSVESLHALETKDLLTLSKQQLVDCSTANQGCNGGLIDESLEYIMENGLESDSQYPYTAQDGACKYNRGDVVATIGSYGTVKARIPDELSLALSRQPIPVTIDAGSRVFQFYKSGIIQPDNCSSDINHATLAVGYGTENGQDYWLIKNSWSDKWGEQGYFRLAKSDNRGIGTCGIHKLRSYYPKSQKAQLIYY